jgi:hypothetical protein
VFIFTDILIFSVAEAFIGTVVDGTLIPLVVLCIWVTLECLDTLMLMDMTQLMSMVEWLLLL